jgi:tetratricopeptide (TPR) repeat protein
MAKKKPYIRLRPRLDPAGAGYPLEMRALLTLGRPKEDANYAEWAERLRGFAPQLIQMTLDDDLNERSEKDRAVWAPLHALSILAELGPEEAAEPLLEVLEWGDDWTTEPLLKYYGRVGKTAAPLLKQRVLDASQEETTRGRAIAALEAIAESHTEERGDIAQFLIDYLEHDATDTLAEEYVITSAILALTDLRAVEALPAIERAFDAARVETFMISLDQVKRAFDLAPETSEEQDRLKQSVNLSLKCLACGRERNYKFERAYYDVSVSEHSDAAAMGRALYTNEPVVCQRCGAVEQYEIGRMGQLVLSAAFAARMGNGENPLPGLKIVSFPQSQWGWLPPRQALARYREEIARKPGALKLRVQYGDALATVDEHVAASEQYEQALLIDPLCGNALLGLADQASYHAEIPEAIAIWERIDRDADKLWFLDDDEVEVAVLRQLVERALVHLRAGERLPPPPELDFNDEARIDRAFMAGVNNSLNAPAQQQPLRGEEFTVPDRGQYGKVGRNEPCPCGSGKKYKQCHGRK